METLERILNLLKKNKIQQKDFAQELGLKGSAITDWKNGKSESYKKYIYQIADYLETNVRYLLCETDDPASPSERKFLPREALKRVGIINPKFSDGRSVNDLTEEDVQEIIEIYELTQKQREERARRRKESEDKK